MLLTNKDIIKHKFHAAKDIVFAAVSVIIFDTMILLLLI